LGAHVRGEGKKGEGRIEEGREKNIIHLVWIYYVWICCIQVKGWWGMGELLKVLPSDYSSLFGVE